MASPAYPEYLARLEEALRRSGPGSHRRLDEPKFEELMDEHERLLRRMDPADIQLDEWKRLEELRFLLILAEEDDEGN